MKKIILVFLAMVLYIHVGKSQSQKVGINTLTPEETLHVIGDIILLESPDGTKKIMLRTAGGDGELKSLGDLYLRSQGNDIIMNHVPTDGNVGIGTISASEKLTVEGAIKVGTSGNMTNDAGTLKFESGDFLGYDGSTWKSFTNGGSSVWTESGSNVYYLGSVGVNTTSPNADLHVVGDSLLLQSPDGTKNLLFRNAGADSEVKSIGDLYIRGQGNDVIINHVASDGNVGIGTGSPMEQLDINGAIKIGTTILDNTGTIRFEGGDFEGYDGTEWKSLTSGGGGVWDENGTSAYYNGSVGINTANPNADLHVVGDTLLFQSPDGTKNLLLRNAGADSEIKSIGDLYLRGQGNDVIINHVATDGNVGIGTGAPSEQLEVNGGVKIGTTTTDNIGTIRFEGSDFEGYDGSTWKSLTNGGSGSGVFENVGGTVKNTGSNDDDFVFGMDELPQNGTTYSEHLFFFDESKGAFRAGRLSNSVNWNTDSLGTASIAMGQNAKAESNYSIAIGSNVEADNVYATAMGNNTIASGSNSMAFGVSTKAEGNASTAMGSNTQALGINSTSLGNKTIAQSAFETVIGRNNTIVSPAPSTSEWNGTDRLFVIGNGHDIGIPGFPLDLPSDALTVYKNGNLAIGNDRVTFNLNETTDRHGVINLWDGQPTSERTIKIDAQRNGNIDSGSAITMFDADGNEKIRLVADNDINGDSRITTDELEIKGGSDFAEHFDIIEETLIPSPGMVVSIDPNSTGKLTITKESYDRKVAGIISGANGVETGLFMGQDGSIADGDYPIALTGRVYVYANNEGGEIQPGDVLTTSSTKGYAMKVEDYSRAQGAIIGKAMTTIDENGFVLVLVNLQ